MTGLVESTTSDDQSERGDGHYPPAPARARSRGSRLAAFGGWRALGWLCCGIFGGVAIVWFILLGPGESGSKSDWFFAAAVLCAVMVAMWQTVTVQRQANRMAAEAAQRMRTEIEATERRMARELELFQKLHMAELESQQQSHRAAMDAQRQQAEIERRHLRSQLQKQAVVEVSRAVNVHAQTLGSLWTRGAVILQREDRDEREQAMLPLFEQISLVVNDFSVELANAHQIVDDALLRRALEGVNEAVLMGIRVAQDVCDGIVDGRESEPNPIPPVQRLMYEKAAEARRLAWNLVRTGLDAGR
jgi:hypothetical protein